MLGAGMATRRISRGRIGSGGALVSVVTACVTGCVPTRGSPPTEQALGGVRALAACESVKNDSDHDAIDDACEAALAEAFAPVVLHSSAESVLPTDVDDFLRHASFGFFDRACAAGEHLSPILVAPTQDDLLGRSATSPCDAAVVTSDGSRSDRKRRGFFLANIDEPARNGSLDGTRWKTYVHAYPNDLAGVTLQYWRFYPYNRATFDHGGDWEAVYVVLSRAREPVTVGLLGHRSIEEVGATRLTWEGSHPVVYSDIGGHTSMTSGSSIPSHGIWNVDRQDPASFIEQETWTGGSVRWPDGRVSRSGGLIPLGEKTAPSDVAHFLRYSGLWGSPTRWYVTSGYWGPAYNETGMGKDGFITAWCAGMAAPLDRKTECYPERQGP
jgi:hypothetical protein